MPHVLQPSRLIVLTLSVGPVANATDVLQPSRLIVLTLSVGPMANATDVLQPSRLIVLTLRLRLPRQFRDLLCAENLRHGTHGFTYLPKEGVLRIFSP